VLVWWRRVAIARALAMAMRRVARELESGRTVREISVLFCAEGGG
jgi:hypothetical protein